MDVCTTHELTTGAYFYFEWLHLYSYIMGSNQCTLIYQTFSLGIWIIMNQCIQTLINLGYFWPIVQLPYYSQLSFFLFQSCVFFFYTCHKICNEGYHFQYRVSLIRHHPQIVATQSRTPSKVTLE